MHAFPPVGARVALVIPVIGMWVLDQPAPVVAVPAAPAQDVERVLAPPGMQFAKTVALLR